MLKERREYLILRRPYFFLLPSWLILSDFLAAKICQRLHPHVTEVHEVRKSKPYVFSEFTDTATPFNHQSC